MPENKQENNVKLLRLMSRAVNEELLIPDYRPVLHLRHPEIQIYWILCTMKADTGQTIGYSSLRTLAKMAEMSGALDRWLMQTGLSTLKELHNDDPNAKVIVPQSMKSLTNEDYPRWLERQVELMNVSIKGLVVAFRLPHIAKHLKPARKCYSVLRKMGAQTMIDAFTDHPAALKILRAMEPRYANISNKLFQCSDNQIQKLIKSCQKRRVSIFLSGIEKPTDVNLVWSEGAELMEGKFIHPPVEHTNYQFPPVII